ncbi:NAD(P)-dependent oxidoreductase [Pelagibius sp. Alg239-R121]|uniref:NAD(P)-dependent oxidoreductase n=1 Tax=Pelagibius sp. Alg239-R121 TaxID=2993448 RepID=UPI0024A6FD89|nr:NAD(P)-dependent oxidoreductase [Pelagibius sp. Alg239-R121]
MSIGFIGLGAMGYGMASNLLAKGFDLRVIANRNRQPIEALVALGAMECKSYAELALQSDVLLLCLPDSNVVEQVVAELEPNLRKGQILVDTGTSSLSSTAKLAERMSALGVEFAEAPLTGGTKQAEAGQLGALVGADDALFDRIEPILRGFCVAVQHFGAVGAGGRAKFVNNYMVFGIAALVFEAFHAADVAGSDWTKLYDVVIRGSADSGVFRRVIGGAIEDDFKGYVFTVKSAYKDMRYITEMNEQLGLSSPLNKAVLDIFSRAEAEGYGDLMISELLRGDIRKARGGV